VVHYVKNVIIVANKHVIPRKQAAHLFLVKQKSECTANVGIAL